MWSVVGNGYLDITATYSCNGCCKVPTFPAPSPLGPGCTDWLGTVLCIGAGEAFLVALVVVDVDGVALLQTLPPLCTAAQCLGASSARSTCYFLCYCTTSEAREADALTQTGHFRRLDVAGSTSC